MSKSPLILLFFAIGSLLFGQELTTHISQLDLERWPQVTLYLSILDAKQQPITEIQSFQIYENQQLMTQEDPNIQGIQGITSFLLIDNSGSMEGSKLVQAKEAAKTFIKLKRPQDKIALYAFSSGPGGWKALVSPTENEALLQNYINEMTAEGKTEYFFAIAKTFNDMQKYTGRRSLITLTDGRDTTDWQNLERKWQIIERVATAKVPIYTIGLGEDVERSDLVKIAEMTNGNFQYAPTEKDLVQIFKQKAEQISGEYVLRYSSPDLSQSGKPRAVEVRFEYQGKLYTLNTSYLSGGLIPKAAVAKTTQEASQKTANHLSIFLTLSAILFFLGTIPALLKMMQRKTVALAPSAKKEVPALNKRDIPTLTKQEIQGIPRIKIQEATTPQSSRVKIVSPDEKPAESQKPRIKFLDSPDS
ncbi:MAG: VWA domain-containing protein [Planctomycetota bacterium]